MYFINAVAFSFEREKRKPGTERLPVQRRTRGRCNCVSHSHPSDRARSQSGFDIGGTGPTFGGEYLGGELQSLDVVRPDIVQADGHLLGLAVEELRGHCAGQLFFGQRLRRVG